VSNGKTVNNKPLTVKEIHSCLPALATTIANLKPYRVIALGKTAEKALTLLRLQYYAMPHPSGRNRLLNDPKHVEEKIKGMRAYLIPSTTES
jgi:uracil-DNA glycosylase